MKLLILTRLYPKVSGLSR